MWTTFRRWLFAGLALFVLLQFARPGIPARPATAAWQAPPEVQQILTTSCYSCHSDERRLSWFDQIVPGYWLVRHDILTAREHLNFSTLGAKPAAAQKGTLYEAVNMIQLGAMPLPQYVALHPQARVTARQLATLKAYLAPWTPALQPAAGPPPAGTFINLAAVPPEFDGLVFDPAFAGWKPISFTDRGDNRTFRFILGNDVAVHAAQTGNITPWPNGARFAKIAWQQELGSDGLVHPGKFIQVELMVKNAHDYKDTQGWGWGRWRGLDLKPYGQNARFVGECTGCHQSLKGNDFVYTIPITQAKVNGLEVVNNTAASLPASLPYQPLAWGAITLYVDPSRHTMATLYGDNAALQAARRHRPYPEAAVLALVTWRQREDPHWFGARIPGQPQTVEFVQTSPQPVYRRYEGSGLVENRAVDVVTAANRSAFLLSLPPAQLP